MVITVVKPHSALHNQGIQMATTNLAPGDISPSPRHLPGEMLSSAERKLDNRNKKLDQAIEFLKQFTIHGDQMKRIPWK